METTERTVQREMARLETWLAVYALSSRKLGRVCRMSAVMRSVPLTSESLAASALGR